MAWFLDQSEKSSDSGLATDKYSSICIGRTFPPRKRVDAWSQISLGRACSTREHTRVLKPRGQGARGGKAALHSTKMQIYFRKLSVANITAFSRNSWQANSRGLQEYPNFREIFRLFPLILLPELSHSKSSTQLFLNVREIFALSALVWKVSEFLVEWRGKKRTYTPTFCIWRGIKTLGFLTTFT